MGHHLEVCSKTSPAKGTRYPICDKLGSAHLLLEKRANLVLSSNRSGHRPFTAAIWVRVPVASPIAFVIVLKALNFSTIDFRDCPSDPHWFNKNLKTSLAAPFYVRFRFSVKNGKNLQLMSALCICVFAKEICFNIEQWRNGSAALC